MDAELDRDPHQSRQAAQLRLLDPATRPDWRLDERTRAVGRQGVAAARAALASARRAHPDPDDHVTHTTAA